MPTISVPLQEDLAEFVRTQVKRGYAHNKAEVVRKAIRRLAEEEAIAAVLSAEQQVREGKILRGDLRGLMKALP